MTRVSPLRKQGAAAALAAAIMLAAAPALATQHSVSGTIAGHKAAPASAVAAAPAAASTPAAAAADPAPAAASAAASAETAAPAAAAPAASAAVANNGMVTPSPRQSFDLGPAPQPSSTGSLFQTGLALLFVLALLVGLAWLLKRFGPRTLGGGNNTVRLVGALNVGARERILVVEVGEQWIVVGASPGRMNALATMPRQEIDAAALPQGGLGLPSANFAEWFKQTIEKRNGK